MYFLIDNKLKIIFGWSAKCGCSHIKKIFGYLQNDIENNVIHTNKDFNNLPNDIENYTTILIIRNPYERIISGFLDKYREGGEFRFMWKQNTLTFTNFVDELVKNNWEMVEKHHFTPQTSECFNSDAILKSKVLKVYNIKNINYKYIEQIYNKNIPKTLINFRGGHERNSTIELNTPVFDLDFNSYNDKNIKPKYFYNKNIRNKVYNFYKNDFIFFENCGFIFHK